MRGPADASVNAIRPTHFTYHVTRKLPCLVITTDVSLLFHSDPGDGLRCEISVPLIDAFDMLF